MASPGSGWLTTSDVVAKWLKVAADAKAAENGSIAAAGFADAATTLISVFDLISGMGMAKSDMDGNATTVKKAASDKTLQALVDAECEGLDEKGLKKVAGDGTKVTCALLWLARALFFILKMLEPLVKEPSKRLSDCVLAGYEVSLKPHHGFIIRQTFSAAVMAAPSREKFMAKLGELEEGVLAELTKVMPHVEALLKAIRDFLLTKSPTILNAFDDPK